MTLKTKKSKFQWILIYLNQLWPQHTIDFEKILVSLSKENHSTSSFASLTYDSIWRMKYFFGTSLGLNIYALFLFGRKQINLIFFVLNLGLGLINLLDTFNILDKKIPSFASAENGTDYVPFGKVVVIRPVCIREKIENQWAMQMVRFPYHRTRSVPFA